MTSKRWVTDAQLRLPLRVNARLHPPIVAPVIADGLYRVTSPFVGALSWAEHSLGQRFPVIESGTLLRVQKAPKGFGYFMFEGDGDGFVALLSAAQVQVSLTRMEEETTDGLFASDI